MCLPFAYICGCLPPNMFNVFQYLAPPLKHSCILGHHFFQLQLWTLATWWIPSWIYAERTLPPWRWVFGVKVLRVSDRSVVRFEPYCAFNTFILHIFEMLFQAKGLGDPGFFSRIGSLCKTWNLFTLLHQDVKEQSRVIKAGRDWQVELL